MKAYYLILIFFLLAILSSCSTEDAGGASEVDPAASADGSFSGGSSGSGNGSGNNNQSGLITAGEWNDLDNWGFWESLLNGQEFSEMPTYWGFYTNQRVSVQVKGNDGNPMIDAQVELRRGNSLVWASKTDNLGKAELWLNLFEEGSIQSMNEYTLFIDGNAIPGTVKRINEGVNEITLNVVSEMSHQVDLSFIVDATGSMGDELEFLKDDLLSVIQRTQAENSSIDIRTSTVFYRDEGDDYVVRSSDFSHNLNTTMGFINQQSANGGGDYPEAVHTALETAIRDLQWSLQARTRIAFLLLDAPPHYEPQVVNSIQSQIVNAAQKGIKIIPITASGIDKQTEFLMRFLSISTNGTYVFITDDSGIGEAHLKPSVGEYEVEFLNDLMVRLITQYVQ